MSASLHFGPHRLHPDQIFYESDLCYGIVNLKPITPGHVLIITKRVCDRLGDLSKEEVTDLFLTVHEVIRIRPYHTLR